MTSKFLPSVDLTKRFLSPKCIEINNVRFYVIIKVYKYSDDILIFTIVRFHKDISFPKCIEIKNIRFYKINKIYK